MKSIILEGAKKILGQLSRILHHPEKKKSSDESNNSYKLKKKMKNKIKPKTQSQRKEWKLIHITKRIGGEYKPHPYIFVSYIHKKEMHCRSLSHTHPNSQNKIFNKNK